MKFSHQKALLWMITMAACSLLSACGASKSFVKSATVSTSTQNGDPWVNLDLALNTANLVLPSVSLPIGGSDSIGRVTLNSTLGDAQLVISADLKQIAHVPGADGHFLPDGAPIPIGNVANVPVLAIPTGSGTVIYVSLSTSQLMVGVAVPVTQFQQIGTLLGGLNYFPSFNFGKVQGVAGIYTGSSSGLAFFIDASSALQTQQGASVREMARDVSSVLTYSGIVPNRRTQGAVQHALFNLGNSQAGKPLSTE